MVGSLLFALLIVLIIIIGATYVYAPDKLAAIPGFSSIMPRPITTAPASVTAPAPTPLPPAPVSRAPEPAPTAPAPTPSAPTPSAPTAPVPSAPTPSAPAPTAPAPTAPASTPLPPAPTPLPPAPVSKAPEPAPVVTAPAVATNVHLSGCEADSAVLKCSSGAIKSGTFRYGRWDNSTCPHVTINPGVAPKVKSYPITSSCVGKSSCTMSSYNSTFGEDIYPNIYKHWEVDYTCQ